MARSFSLKELAEHFGMQTKDEQKKQKNLQRLMDDAYSQYDLANFIVNNEVPTHMPQLKQSSSNVKPELVSDIVVFLTLMEGNLPSLTKFCFLFALESAGALKNLTINQAWTALTHDMNQSRFFMSGPSLLKTFLLAVNRAYYPEDTWEQFTALILKNTDSYFHPMVTKVFETRMFAQRGEGGNMVMCD
jgi:hypothetical protein